MWGLIDFYLVGPALSTAAGKQWSAKDFSLRDRLGGGNFGVTYEAVQVKDVSALPLWGEALAVVNRVRCLRSGTTCSWAWHTRYPPPPLLCAAQKSEAIGQRTTLTPEQKKRRVVLKRVNMDKSEVRLGGGGCSKVAGMCPSS